MPHFKQHCVDCSREYRPNLHLIRCDCGGLINFDYQTPCEWPLSKKQKNLSRYWPMLPIKKRSTIIQPSLSSYPTPLYKSRKLGSFLGLRHLWIKDESKNFTKTFKARDALVSVSRFQEIGLTEFVMCSTGNTAAAFSYVMRYLRKPMTVHMFFPKWTVIDLEPRMKRNTRVTVVNGGYDETIWVANEFCAKNRLPLEGGFSNPSRIEGSKTIAYEIAESGLKPDWYVQAVTSGTGVYSLRKGYRELQAAGVVDSIPKLLCVQPEGCAPMVKAFRGGQDKIDANDTPSFGHTFATTLSNTNPSFSFPYVRRAVLDTHGGFEEVSEAEISYAFLLLLKLEGLLVDPAAATALAGVFKATSEGRIDRDEIIVLNVCGGLRYVPRSRPG